MNRALMLAALVAFGSVIFDSTLPANAACDAICQSKCEATAAAGGFTVQGCVQFYAYVNGHYTRDQVRGVVNGTFWTRDLCQLKCRLTWRNFGYTSVRACEAAIPCSNFR